MPGQLTNRRLAPSKTQSKNKAGNVPGQFLGCRELVRMRACPKHASERSLYYIGLSKGLSVAGWLRHPGARPSARSQRRAILAPGCARKPGGRTPVLSARRVPRLSSRLARQLAFLRKPMAAHGVPLLKRGFDGASCTAPPSAMFAATMRPASHPAVSGGGPRGRPAPKGLGAGRVEKLRKPAPKVLHSSCGQALAPKRVS